MLTILAYAGGSPCCRPRAWKHALQHRLCNPHGLTVTVAHYPSGCSKWNPVKHQLFSFISRNWADRPLDSFETGLNSIRTTTTRPGLRVEAALLPDTYPTGIEIEEGATQQLQLFPADDLPAWNYTNRPSAGAAAQGDPLAVLRHHGRPRCPRPLIAPLPAVLPPGNRALQASLKRLPAILALRKLFLRLTIARGAGCRRT